MPITIDRLGRASAVCLAAAEDKLVAVQINHPPLDLDLVGTTEFLVRQTEKTVMTTLALVGIAGLHPRQTVALGRPFLREAHLPGLPHGVLPGCS